MAKCAPLLWLPTIIGDEQLTDSPGPGLSQYLLKQIRLLNFLLNTFVKSQFYVFFKIQGGSLLTLWQTSSIILIGNMSVTGLHHTVSY